VRYNAAIQFLAGAVAFGYVLAAVFFLRFWRTTGDRLFARFAVAFALLGLNRTLASLLQISAEQNSLVDVLRVAAFLIILLAIIQKNLGPEDRRRGPR
jgi:hypothetical protein